MTFPSRSHPGNQAIGTQLPRDSNDRILPRDYTQVIKPHPLQQGRLFEKQGVPVVLQHVAFWQTLPGRHTLPHPPQLLGSFCIFVSQPSAYTPLQSIKPGEHTCTTQVPFEQPLCCTFGALQTCPQAPQLLGSDCSLTHVPLQQLPEQQSLFPTQVVPFEWQGVTHVPPEQV